MVSAILAEGWDCLVFEGPVQDLIDELGKLPGVGPKSAQRIAFHLLGVEAPDIDRLTAALTRVRDGVQFCEVCGNVSDKERCRICADPRRDIALVCVVEEPKDVQAVERTREFRGRYHVLGGALDPLSGVGPDQLRIRELLTRIGTEEDGVSISEVIIATDPNTEGEATATYLVRMLRDFPGLTVTRLASGLPMGGDLEFADELTLGRALSGRRPSDFWGSGDDQELCLTRRNFRRRRCLRLLRALRCGPIRVVNYSNGDRRVAALGGRAGREPPQENVRADQDLSRSLRSRATSSRSSGVSAGTFMARASSRSASSGLRARHGPCM